MEVPLILGKGDKQVHVCPPERLIEELGTSLEKGLPRQTAHARREQEGTNVVPSPNKCPGWLCCLLPCILSTRKNKLFAENVPEEANVLRNGKWLLMDYGSIVRGDIVKIKEGDIIPADIRLLKCSPDMKVEGAAITGDSMWRPCTTESTDENVLMSHNMVFTAYTCTKGEGIGVAVGCGSNTLFSQLIKAGTWPPPGLA
uniref:Cation-transporting P-type ATPase N-terminal domain-containing protein n=1 Tax=Fibrocapsa japonica TaxID=94617 RepID=A0A7S2USP6_9STRA